jgi:hypothetical protein
VRDCPAGGKLRELIIPLLVAVYSVKQVFPQSAESANTALSVEHWAEKSNAFSLIQFASCLL